MQESVKYEPVSSSLQQNAGSQHLLSKQKKNLVAAQKPLNFGHFREKLLLENKNKQN